MKAIVVWSKPLLLVALMLTTARGVSAQTVPGPFWFTVATRDPRVSGRWTLDDVAGYGKRASEPLGLDGFGPRQAVRGGLGRGVTVLSQTGIDVTRRGYAGPSGLRNGLDVAADLRSTAPQMEVLKDVSSAGGVDVAVGLGARRETQGTSVLLGRVTAGHAFRRSSLFGNVRFERAFEPHRDRVDMITSVGWLRQLGSRVHVGAEAIGEDLEGFWEAEEAEGGAKVFLGPSIHLSSPTGHWSASLSGGPIVYATRSGRSNLAAGRLAEPGQRYAVRLSLAYWF